MFTTKQTIIIKQQGSVLHLCIYLRAYLTP